MKSIVALLLILSISVVATVENYKSCLECLYEQRKLEAKEVVEVGSV